MGGRLPALLTAAIAGLLFASPHDTAAQVCAGGPSLSEYGGSLGGGFSFFDGGGGFDVHATFGTKWFGTVVIGRTGFDDTSVDLSSVSLTVGHTSDVPGEADAYLCPNLELARGWWGVDVFEDDLGTSLLVSPSLGIGVDLASPGFSLIPFAQIGLDYTNYSFDLEDRDETDGRLTLGVGFNSTEHDVLIVPSVAISLISDPGDTVIRLQIDSALGGGG